MVGCQVPEHVRRGLRKAKTQGTGGSIREGNLGTSLMQMSVITTQARQAVWCRAGAVVPQMGLAPPGPMGLGPQQHFLPLFSYQVPGR